MADSRACASKLPVCVVGPVPPSPSETFIRAHYERLPAKVIVLPATPPFRRSVSADVWRGSMRLLFGRNRQSEKTAWYSRAIRKSRCQVVLAEYGPTAVMLLDAARRSNTPLVVHFHGFDAAATKYLDQYREGYPRMFREAAGIVVVSRAMREQLLSLGASPEKVYLNPYGVDCETFDGADPANSPPVLIAVGRFTEKKAPHLTVLAFAEARKAIAEARLRMIGDGPLLPVCQQLAAALGIDEAVDFLGVQPPEVVRREMRAARAFVQHSITASNGDCEGTPNAILEAAASGLPVIATRHGGIPDVLIDGETGLLVDEQDVRGTAEHLVRILESSDLAAALGKAARADVVREHGMAERLGRLVAILDMCRRSALSEKKGSPGQRNLVAEVAST